MLIINAVNAIGAKKEHIALANKMKWSIPLKKDIQAEVQELLLPLCIPDYFDESKPSDILGDVDYMRIGCGIEGVDLSFMKEPQIIIFRTLANQRIPHPHIDGTGIQGKPHYFTINIPLKGCDKPNHDMLFYKELPDMNDLERIQQWKGKFDYHTWRPNPDTYLELEETLIVDRPYLINPSGFHHVDNHKNPEDRYMAAIRFKNKFPTWEEALEEFKDLIDNG